MRRRGRRGEKEVQHTHSPPHAHKPHIHDCFQAAVEFKQ